MSNSLKFTLKQLLDLGIICSHKKKKRRNSAAKNEIVGATMSYLPPQRQPFPQRQSFLQGQSFPQQVNQFADPFDPNRYTQTVRLREEQDRLKNENLELRMRQQNLQEGIMNEFKNVYNTRQINDDIQEEGESAMDLGFADDDNAGAFGASANDEDFIPQAGGFVREEEEVGFGIAPEQMPVEEFPQELQPEPPQRAARRTLSSYKVLYSQLSGADADPSFFKATKVSEIKPEIIKLLLAEYRSIGGNNKDVLRSKNIDTISREISLLQTILKSP